MMAIRFLLFLMFLSSCPSSFGQRCAGMPEFVETWGFDQGRIALSTSERHLKGLVLVELDEGDLRKAKRIQEFQHPSWDDEGFLSTIARDRAGNVYVAPKPNVSMLYTRQEHLNSVFKVDAKTGIMEKFVDLPVLYDRSIENAFGILGVHYSCDANKLFVSTLMGSDSKKERGRIYAVDVYSGQVELILDEVDALGLHVFRDKNGMQHLVFSSARNSYIYDFLLNQKGASKQVPKAIINLEGLGPRGDDKARKIEMKNGKLIVTGTSFNYNLSVPHYKVETEYIFFGTSDGNWKLISYR